MLMTEQTEGQTIYQHGLSVQSHFFDLLDHLKFESNLSNWRLPSWIKDYKDQILSNLHSEEVISAYTLYHDCGKPFCRIVDIDGKIHFPNHAEKSKEIFLSIGGNPIAAALMGWDMDCHILNSSQIQSRCENDWTIQDACTLLLVALSELHSNSKLFGNQNNLESISFKIKWKTLDRRGNQICKFYFNGGR